MGVISAGMLDRLIRIEAPQADTSFAGAGSGTWTLLAEVWAQVRDTLPSRAEKVGDGINMATRPARVRMWFRDDVTPAMRFVSGDRIMQIVSGPAELGRREGVEFMVEEYRPAGNRA
jgi:head-tail adaptor